MVTFTCHIWDNQPEALESSPHRTFPDGYSFNDGSNDEDLDAEIPEESFDPGEVYEIPLAEYVPDPRQATVWFLSLQNLTESHLDWLDEQRGPLPGGLSSISGIYGLAVQNEDQRTILIHIASGTRCLSIAVGKQHRRPEPFDPLLQVRIHISNPVMQDPVAALDAWLSDSSKIIVGTEIWYSILLLYKDLGIKSTSAYDAHVPPRVNDSLQVAKNARADETAMDIDLSTNEEFRHFVSLAILSYNAFIERCSWSTAPVQDTSYAITELNEKYLPMCMFLATTTTRVAGGGRNPYKCEYDHLSNEDMWGQRYLKVQQSRFATRVRENDKVTIQLQDGCEVPGDIRIVKGKSAFITPSIDPDQVVQIIVLPTQKGLSGDTTLCIFLKKLLSGDMSLLNVFTETLLSPLTRLYTTQLDMYKPDVHQQPITIQKQSDETRIDGPEVYIPYGDDEDDLAGVNFFGLNNAQASAVQMIFAPKHEFPALFIYVHGPPGTGKTTVISTTASILSKIFTRLPNEQKPQFPVLLVVANSNIAVKNVAEKLHRTGHTQFLTVVSEDFYFEWHEGQYFEFSDRIVISKRIPENSRARPYQKAQESCVFLCTLSMMSNAKMMTRVLKNRIVKWLLVDEASQADLAAYPWVLSQLPTLEKVVFLGDEHQLPPFGFQVTNVFHAFDALEPLKETLPKTVSSIHLRTQYRLPRPLANFLSENVYKPIGLVTPESRPEDNTNSVLWVNVSGRQKKQGHSWTNQGEATVIHRLISVRRLYETPSRIAILTGYDAHRALLRNKFTHRDYACRERCYNIDSFQGHEADIVFASLVRTDGVGFMSDRQRINVMLSRAKRELLVVGDFMHAINANAGLMTVFARWCASQKRVVSVVEYMKRVAQNGMDLDEHIEGV
ncbi:uncharacterized protein SPPG_04525 [Spizellomyces punctatus DAOM BR117]|uniref:AAA+ ATPase domain-containing protein n=1 Tax=Spizellomyces punctatus (strain DAOM BR117) TaxID=645134 RepID=A0A0L0HHB8_SPIPD|nr:uncharacterized protein SPPG_04525 [Spizellomyces punctatus DAOM BR117]KND00184.1 hypothetical protein SPPG_04525 [Spizellomyces punctatus DAOM BR117]|eukprot:XP_016608223.1 hypothetical protein SPPG_04525 [Spizellomyces punctatus DAOM BR117]